MSKRNRLTIGEKRQICVFSEENPMTTHKSISEIFTNKFGKSISRPTITKILAKKRSLMAIPEKYQDAKRSRHPLEILLEDEIYQEVESRLQWAPMTCKDVQFLAKNMSKNTVKYGNYFESFKFDVRWVQSWKKVYEVGYGKMKGNRKIIPLGKIRQAKAKGRRAMQNFLPRNILNSDTTAVYPMKNGMYSLQLRSSNQSVNNGDIHTRISVNSLVNVTGTISDHFLIVRSFSKDLPKERRIGSDFKIGNPNKGGFVRRIYQGDNGERIIIYRNSSAWNNQFIFRDYMRLISEKLTREYPNELFLLFLDNFKGHKLVDYGEFPNIQVEWLEPNMTGYYQPLGE